MTSSADELLAEKALVALREAQSMAAYLAVMHLKATLFDLAPSCGAGSASARFIGSARYDAWIAVSKVIDALRKGAEPASLWKEASDKIGVWQSSHSSRSVPQERVRQSEDLERW